MPLEQEKKRFLTYELGLLSRKAALSTRNAGSPVYLATLRSHQRGRAKDAIRAELAVLEQLYISEVPPSEAEYFEVIQATANRLSNNIGQALHNGRFRIGIAQKLLNMHLKYLWVAGLIDEPPHCPIDGIIRDRAGIEYDWTSDDDIGNYRNAVVTLTVIAQAEDKSLAQWELCAFRRRDDR